MTIKKTHSIEEIFTTFPEYSLEIAEELHSLGLGCVGCHAAAFETLEEGLRNHGMNEKQINEVVEKLNQIINIKKSD